MKPPDFSPLSLSLSLLLPNSHHVGYPRILPFTVPRSLPRPRDRLPHRLSSGSVLKFHPQVPSSCSVLGSEPRRRLGSMAANSKQELEASSTRLATLV